VLLIPLAPGWEAVRKSFFDGAILAQTFPGLLQAFLLDIAIFLWCAPAIAILGLVIALFRDARSPALFPLRLFGILYTDVFRGVPVILIVYLIGFGVPGLGLPRPWNSPYIWGSLALILTYSAYVAEIYRSGIDAVPESQRASARALGLTQTQALRYAILPQAVRNVVPALMNTVVSLQKDVALVSVIGIRDALREAEIITARTFNYTPYMVATLLFLALSVPMTRAVDWYTARDRRLRSQSLV